MKALKTGKDGKDTLRNDSLSYLELLSREGGRGVRTLSTGIREDSRAKGTTGATSKAVPPVHES